MEELPVITGTGSACLCHRHLVEVDDHSSGDIQSAPADCDETADDKHG